MPNGGLQGLRSVYPFSGQLMQQLVAILPVANKGVRNLTFLCKLETRSWSRWVRWERELGGCVWSNWKFHHRFERVLAFIAATTGAEFNWQLLRWLNFHTKGGNWVDERSVPFGHIQPFPHPDPLACGQCVSVVLSTEFVEGAPFGQDILLWFIN